MDKSQKGKKRAIIINNSVLLLAADENLPLEAIFTAMDKNYTFICSGEIYYDEYEPYFNSIESGEKMGKILFNYFPNELEWVETRTDEEIRDMVRDEDDWKYFDTINGARKRGYNCQKDVAQLSEELHQKNIPLVD